MVRHLGLSVYPQKAPLEAHLAYVEKGATLGFTRLFVALLGADLSKAKILADYAPITRRAKELGYDVCCDVSGSILEAVCGKGMFGNYDLSFFNEIGVSTLRLDMGLSEIEETFFSKNRYGINLEFNMSFPIDHVGGVLKSGGDPSRIAGCHNYYPHRYTGLSRRFFDECNAVWQPHHLKTSAFISTQSPSKFGPWPVCDGCTTLEMHRDLPLEVQLKHYVAMNVIDDVLIGDAFASDAELQALAKVDRQVVSLAIQHLDPSVANSPLWSMTFSRRPDSNEFMIRTLESRFFMAMHDIPPHNTVAIQRGDILLENNDYGQYKGELQIALQPMVNSGRTNVIGHISEIELFLLDEIKPGQAFKFER